MELKVLSESFDGRMIFSFSRKKKAFLVHVVKEGNVIMPSFRRGLVGT